MNIKNEHSLYPIIIEFFAKEKWDLFRIEDGSVGKKPFDIGGISNDGRAVAIEVKYEKNKQPDCRPPFRLLRKHQEKWLNTYGLKNGISLFIIYYEMTNTYVIWNFNKKGKWVQASSIQTNNGINYFLFT